MTFDPDTGEVFPSAAASALPSAPPPAGEAPAIAVAAAVPNSPADEPTREDGCTEGRFRPAVFQASAAEPCPRPVNSAPDGTTTAECMERGECGCGAEPDFREEVVPNPGPKPVAETQHDTAPASPLHKVTPPLPTVTLDDGTQVVPATLLPPPSVQAMATDMQRLAPGLAKLSVRNRPRTAEYAQDIPPDDDPKIPTFLRRVPA